MPTVNPAAAPVPTATEDAATATGRQRRPLRIGVGPADDAAPAIRTVRMVAPAGVSTDDAPRNDDGSYDVPMHLADEYRRVHGFRIAAELEREIHLDERVAKQHAEEVAALQAQVNVLTTERDNARADGMALRARIAELDQAVSA